MFTFYTLPDTRVLNSFEELCIMRAAAVNSFARMLNPHGGVYDDTFEERCGMDRLKHRFNQDRNFLIKKKIIEFFKRVE